MGAIQIGWAEADITPEGPVELYGQYYPRVSQGIHSPLSATVMAVEGDNGERLVMVSADIANFKTEYLEELRRRVSAKLPGLVGTAVVMNATHTHNAPAVTPGRQWWESSSEVQSTKSYGESTLESITGAIVRAWESKKKAGIANTTDYAVVGHCRRILYSDGSARMYGDTNRRDFVGVEGSEDSTVELLFTFCQTGEPTGAIVNVACPSQVMEATYRISSDYMGRLREKLKGTFGSDFYTLCQISAAGCQSPRDLARTRDAVFWREPGVEIIAHRVSEAVHRGLNRCKDSVEFDVEMEHLCLDIDLPVRRVSYEEHRSAAATMNSLEMQKSTKLAFADFCNGVKKNEQITGRPGPYDSKQHHFVLIRNSEAVVDRYAEQQLNQVFSLELHTVRLGKIGIVTNPFELFLEYGLRIKAQSPADQTFIVQLCCGTGGYLPTRAAEKHGGYGGLVINGSVGSEGGEKLVDESVAELRGLF